MINFRWIFIVAIFIWKLHYYVYIVYICIYVLYVYNSIKITIFIWSTFGARLFNHYLKLAMQILVTEYHIKTINKCSFIHKCIFLFSTLVIICKLQFCVGFFCFCFFTDLFQWKIFLNSSSSFTFMNFHMEKLLRYQMTQKLQVRKWILISVFQNFSILDRK